MLLGACAALGAASPPAVGLAAAADPFLRRTATVDVVQKVGPAVVNITTERVVQRRSPFAGRGRDPIFDRFFRDFFTPRLGRERISSLGSGVIFDASGHVLTNEHVVAMASRIRVSLADGREFDAELVGADPNNDLAVLRIASEEELPFAAPGSSDDLLVGEPVIAIGNPFGLSNTVTTGVISALDRTINAKQHAFHGFIQTDASINPGNSGGPLLNAEGSLIAINTAIYNGAQGIGFAVPIDVAKRVVAELIEHGEVQPVWLGLSLQDLDGDLVDVMALPDGMTGVLVNAVQAESPAARADIARGDVLREVDGHPLPNRRAFFEILGAVTPGQELDLEIWRSAKTRTLKVAAAEVPDGEIDKLGEKLLGLALTQQGEEARNPGFVVAKVQTGSFAERVGFEAGDRVLALNGQALGDIGTLRRAILDLRGRSRALVVVQRGRGRYHVAIPLA